MLNLGIFLTISVFAFLEEFMWNTFCLTNIRNVYKLRNRHVNRIADFNVPRLNVTIFTSSFNIGDILVTFSWHSCDILVTFLWHSCLNRDALAFTLHCSVRLLFFAAFLTTTTTIITFLSIQTNNRIVREMSCIVVALDIISGCKNKSHLRPLVRQGKEEKTFYRRIIEGRCFDSTFPFDTNAFRGLFRRMSAVQLFSIYYNHVLYCEASDRARTNDRNLEIRSEGFDEIKTKVGNVNLRLSFLLLLLLLCRRRCCCCCCLCNYVAWNHFNYIFLWNVVVWGVIALSGPYY